MIPQDLIGKTVHINYQMDATGPPSQFLGVVEGSTDNMVVIRNEDRSRFVRSYLFTDRIVSIHVMKGETP